MKAGPEKLPAVVHLSSFHLADDFKIVPGVPPRLSLRTIFGKPRRVPLKGSAEFFFVGFNLT